MRGFAGLKFSTSPRRLGVIEISLITKVIVLIMGILSLAEKNGLNLILSGLLIMLEGFEEPFS